METTDKALFDADMELFFETLLNSAREGQISPEQVENFFPSNVKERCKKLMKEKDNAE